MQYLISVIQSLFVRKHIFTGDYADILTARRQWVKTKQHVMILHMSYKRMSRKSHEMIVWYADNNWINRLVGLKPGPAQILKWG